MNSHFTRTKKYSLLGVLNSSTFRTFLGILDIDVPTTDLFLRKYTQHHLITHTKLLHRMTKCMISRRRASLFELQPIRGRQKARRGTCGVRCGTY